MPAAAPRCYSANSSPQFGLLVVIWGYARSRPSAAPFAVGSYITGDVLVHLVPFVGQPGRNPGAPPATTFAGIRPADAPGIILAQLAAAPLSSVCFRCLTAGAGRSAKAGNPVTRFVLVHPKAVQPSHPSNSLLRFANSASPFRMLQVHRKSESHRAVHLYFANPGPAASIQ